MSTQARRALTAEAGQVANPFFQFLCRVHSVSVSVDAGKREDNPSAVALYRGSGAVEVLREDECTIRFEERGEGNVLALDANPMQFQNVLRWSLISDEAVSLEHLRGGISNAVPLARFEKQGPGIWQSREPHLCGEDTYRATATLADDIWSVNWEITGPRKSQVIRFLYSEESYV